MKKLLPAALLAIVMMMIVSSCSKPNIHTTKFRPENYSEFVQED